MLTSSKIKPKRYLDIGCGDGSITDRISRLLSCEDTFGLDIDSQLINQVPSHIKTIQFNLESLGSNKIPFPDGYFDLITGLEIIEHLSYGDDFLTEIRRLLCPKGFFLLSTPNLASLLNRLQLLHGLQPAYTSPSKFYSISFRSAKKINPTNHVHKNLYTMRTLIKMLSLYGFTPYKVRGARMPYDRFSWLPLTKFPSLAPNIVILARRR